METSARSSITKTGQEPKRSQKASAPYHSYSAMPYEQAGFRAGKSCTSQFLNITQHIENGVEEKMITGAVFIDLSAAYDTTKHFIYYADDLDLTAQGLTFEIVENSLKKTLETLTRYYYTNRLKPNPTKTQVCASHLRNRDAKRKIMIKWNGIDLKHCDHPQVPWILLGSKPNVQNTLRTDESQTGEYACPVWSKSAHEKKSRHSAE
ncbi:hypothetical protein AGLY_008303 [Aphis glycines]|uniref:Reverse transcriptase domain-containing protein n=1 Tax=Aphis glycines TaxID=307491 RepID=A0A6G0TLW9_APHGL|nr:hypothetical protein AGLY_008303 [Aphis glycines]